MVEANRVDIAANSRDLADLRESVAETTRNVNQLVSTMQTQQESTNELFETNTRILQMIVQEIKGLRAENRRILAHLFGEQQSE